MAVPNFFRQTPGLTAFYNEGIARHYPALALAGAAGNIMQESEGRTDAMGDNNQAYGLAQWNSRRPQLLSFAQNMGKDWRDPEVQAKFYFHELDTTERRARDAMMTAKTPEEAARAGLLFERPQGYDSPNFTHHPTLGWDRRYAETQKALQSMNGFTAEGPSPDGSESTPMSYAMGGGNGPQDAGGNAIQSTFGMPGSSINPSNQPGDSNNPTSGWEMAGDIGDGMMRAGAALMAIDNPSGASALMAGANRYKNGRQNEWQVVNAPSGKGYMLRNVRTGETRYSMYPPDMQKDPNADMTPLQQNWQFLEQKGQDPTQLLPGHGAGSETPEANLDDDTMKRYVLSEAAGGKLTGNEFGVGKQKNANVAKYQAYKTKMAQELGLEPDAFVKAQSDVRYRNEVARQIGTVDTNTYNASNKMEAAATNLIEASKAYPRGDYKFVNQLVQKWDEQTNDPNLARFKTALDAFALDYATALNPQKKTVTVDDVRHARERIGVYLNDKSLNAVVDQVKGEIAAIRKNAANTHQAFFGKPSPFENQTYGNEPQNGQQAGGAAPAQGGGKRLKWNPATGRVE